MMGVKYLPSWNGLPRWDMSEMSLIVLERDIRDFGSLSANPFVLEYSWDNPWIRCSTVHTQFHKVMI